MAGPRAARALALPVLIPVAVVLVAAPAVLTSYWVGLLTQMVIFSILAMSLDILLGYTGLPSLGHAAFFGVAAYAVAVLATGYGAGFWTCFIGGIVMGTLLAASLAGNVFANARVSSANRFVRFFRSSAFTGPGIGADHVPVDSESPTPNTRGRVEAVRKI